MRIVNEIGVNLEREKGNEEPKFKYYIIPEGSNRVMNDMTDEEKEQTHREKAFKELIEKLNIK